MPAGGHLARNLTNDTPRVESRATSFPGSGIAGEVLLH